MKITSSACNPSISPLVLGHASSVQCPSVFFPFTSAQLLPNMQQPYTPLIRHRSLPSLGSESAFVFMPSTKHGTTPLFTLQCYLASCIMALFALRFLISFVQSSIALKVNRVGLLDLPACDNALESNTTPEQHLC